MEIMENVKKSAVVISPEALLEHWQGHRRLTRKVIAAFPEKDFFTFSVGGMRPFAVLAMEILDLTEFGIKGIVTKRYPQINDLPHHEGNHGKMPKTQADYLAKWDAVTAQLNDLWQQIPLERFQEMEVAFGQYENSIINSILYYIDNEIHHRGQGTVYLRALGIEPPMFWDRY
jgi:uncharacterized damage-inducible protein DinB